MQSKKSWNAPELLAYGQINALTGDKGEQTGDGVLAALDPNNACDPTSEYQCDIGIIDIPL